MPSPYRILVLERDGTQAERLLSLLGGGKAHPLLLTRRDGADALPPKAEVDAVLLGSPGPEILPAVRAWSPGVPVVLLGAASDEACMRAVESGEAWERHGPEDDPGILARILAHAAEVGRLREDLRESRARLQEASFSDPLTNLLNRKGLENCLAQEVRLSKRAGSTILALLVTVDNFRPICAVMGEAVGDLVAKEVGRRLAITLRDSDRVARIAGGEFLSLLPQTRMGEGVRTMERVRVVAAGSPVVLSNRTIPVAVSLGLVEIPGESTPFDELLAQARSTLEQNRASGRQKIGLASGQDAEVIPQESLPPSVVPALSSEESYVSVKHPIHRLADGVRVGYEMLSRSTVAGFELPENFFRICQEANILNLVDSQCFGRCMSASAKLEPNARIHVNLFPSTLLHVSTERLLETIPWHRGNRKYCIELSEQHFIGEPSRFLAAVKNLKRKGVEIAIDDVGLGMTCLEAMILFKPNYVKISPQSVQGIAKDPGKVRSLTRLLGIVRSLGIEAMAEGIETAEDRSALVELGILYGQGFLWGRPD